MANPYRGEVQLTLAGHVYLLRPTFHILCSIEERTGLPLPRLYARLHHKGLLAGEIVAILACATEHDGSDPLPVDELLELPAHQVDLQGVLPEIELFLRLGLGLKTHHTHPAAAETVLDWPQMLQVAVYGLGVSLRDFWQMTMPEYLSLLRVRAVEEPPLAPADIAPLEQMLAAQASC